MKDALFLTGAAARISQEVAIFDKLIEYKGLEVNPENTILAGFSSGALNIGAINACFRKKNSLSWEKDYKENLLFKIHTEDIFKQKKSLPVDTDPLRKSMSDFLKKAEIETLEDCEFISFILAFSYRRLTTIWASNFFNRHVDIDLLDLLMATSAIPIVFPDQKIRAYNDRRNRFLNGNFADGGTGGSFRRFDYYMKRYFRQNEPFDNLYIISPMREISQHDFENLNHMLSSKSHFNINIRDMRIFRLFLDMISQNGFNTFIKRFHKWTRKNKVAENIWVCMPQLEENYPFLNFDLQEEQYNSVIKWVENNPDKLAIPIDEYIKKFENAPLVKIKNRIRRSLKHRLLSIGVRWK